MNRRNYGDSLVNLVGLQKQLLPKNPATPALVGCQSWEVQIGNYITQPAKVEKISDNKIYLTIKEGKFHQIKKMLEAINNKVCYLKRVSFGRLKLNDLALGEVREVNLEDII